MCVLSIVSPFYFMGVPMWEHCQIYLIPHSDGSSWQQSKLLYTGPFSPPSVPFLFSTSLTPCPLAFPLKFQNEVVKSNHDIRLLYHWGLPLPFASTWSPLGSVDLWDIAGNSGDKVSPLCQISNSLLALKKITKLIVHHKNIKAACCQKKK